MKEAFLKQLSLFSHLDAESLSSIANSLEMHMYLKNELIFSEGRVAKHMFMVFDGQIKVFKSTPDGKEHILHFMPKYSIVAEVPMFEGGLYPVSCMSTKDSILFAIPREKLITLIKNDPKIALNMLALQSRRLREFTYKIEQLSLKTTEQKFINYLLKNSDMINDKLIMEVSSIQELSDYLGSTRENLSRVINNLIKKRMVTRDKNMFVLQKELLANEVV